MGAFIAKQPNGLYCRFSTIVDTVTHYNMTEEEYIELCAEYAREQARYDLENRVHPFEEVAVRFIPNNTTVQEFNEVLKKMGSDIVLEEEDYE